MDRIPTPVLGECIKIIRQKRVDCERNFLRELLELYQDMPLTVPPIRRMLLGVTSPIIAPRIGAARDAEKRMLKWSEGMEPRFIGWNVAAAHTFDFSFPDAWSRKKIKALPSRRPEVSAEM